MMLYVNKYIVSLSTIKDLFHVDEYLLELSSINLLDFVGIINVIQQTTCFWHNELSNFISGLVGFINHYEMVTGKKLMQFSLCFSKISLQLFP